MSEAEADDGSGSGGRKELDPRSLPINNIRRVMRSAMPENRKITKDAKESVQECVSEFISFVTSESVPAAPARDPIRASDRVVRNFDVCRASHKCKEEGRKVINGDDIIWSLGTLGFVEYVEPLMLYLKKYREVSFKPPLSSSSCNPVYSVFIILCLQLRRHNMCVFRMPDLELEALHVHLDCGVIDTLGLFRLLPRQRVPAYSYLSLS
jgi:nuclear transcription Y subunit beta